MLVQWFATLVHSSLRNDLSGARSAVMGLNSGVGILRLAGDVDVLGVCATAADI